MPAERQPASGERQPAPPERYEPLPPIAELPGYLWRRMPRAARVGLIALPFVMVALILLLGPGIRESKDEQSQSEAQRLAQNQDERNARLRAEQRPRFDRASVVAPASAPQSEQLAARRQELDQARASVQADARARAAKGELTGPIRRVECEPFPRTVQASGAERDLGRRFGSYSCIAITAEFGGSAAQEASSIGHPYRVRIDFRSGRYAFCKVSGRPGEMAIQGEPAVTVPRVCGGR